jgi:alpha-glucoside transport system substrate-binding protein
VGEGDFNWDSYQAYSDAAPDLSGQTVTVAGPWLSPEAERFDAMLAYFEAATGAEATYTGSDSFEQQIVIDAEAGSAPNIAVFPQPGLAAVMAARGLLTPLGDDMAEWVQRPTTPRVRPGSIWAPMPTRRRGPVLRLLLQREREVAGLVRPRELRGCGLRSARDDGRPARAQRADRRGRRDAVVHRPGIGAATGWPATDWVEDIMLRTQPPEVYDGWVTNEIPFNDERVVNAIETFGMFARNDDWVQGGAGTVATTDFRDAPAGLFASPPGCYMHRQASFIPAFFPEGTVVGEDADFFYFPSFAGEDLGNPVLGGGTLMAITDPSDATMAFMEFLQTPFAHEIMMAQGGFLTPHSGVNLDTYSTAPCAARARSC